MTGFCNWSLMQSTLDVSGAAGLPAVHLIPVQLTVNMQHIMWMLQRKHQFFFAGPAYAFPGNNMCCPPERQTLEQCFPNCGLVGYQKVVERSNNCLKAIQISNIVAPNCAAKCSAPAVCEVAANCPAQKLSPCNLLAHVNIGRLVHECGSWFICSLF